MADPKWNNGNFYGNEIPRAGLSVARMVGHITYMSEKSMAEKFGRRTKSDQDNTKFHADFEVEEDRDEDLLQALERELARRRFGSPVRLEVATDMTENMLDLLLRELDVHPGDVIEVPGLLDLSSLWQIYGVDRPDLKDRPFVPATPPAFGERETPKSIFATLRDGDVLVHHPYDSFSTTVQRFIEQAAADPNVLAIKQTLYRTSGDSPIVNALIDAAEAGMGTSDRAGDAPADGESREPAFGMPPARKGERRWRRPDVAAHDRRCPARRLARRQGVRIVRRP